MNIFILKNAIRTNSVTFLKKQFLVGNCLKKNFSLTTKTLKLNKTPFGGIKPFFKPSTFKKSLPKFYLSVGLVSAANYSKFKSNEDLQKTLEDATIASSDEKDFDYILLFKYLKDEVLLIIVAVVSALCVAFLNIKIPLSLGELVNIVSQSFSSTSSNNHKFFSEIQLPFFQLLSLFCAQSFLTFIYISTLSLTGERLANKLRANLFGALLKQDISFFDHHRSGDLISRLTTDIQDFKSSFKLIVSQGLRSCAQITGSIISIYLISPKMTGLVVVVLPSFILIGSLLGSLLRTLSRRAQEQIAKSIALADEAICNIRTVRAFAMEDKELELYKQEVDKVEKLNASLGFGIGIFQSVSNLALNGIVLGVIATGGYLISSQDLTPGSLMAFLIATQSIQKSLAQVSLLFGHCVKGVAAGTRVFEYIKKEPINQLKGGIKLTPQQLKGNVEFENVSFSYPTRKDETVLKDLNLTLPSGKIVAICGLSGQGKSTLAVLLEKFYDVTEGAILLDGYNLNDLDPSWLRGNVIGYISQEPILFATSILENIRYGNPSATDEQVREVAKLANADDFISKFSNGYQTVLGERGVTISGGQKQRIAIARALIKDPKILILDEATSALDTESEKVVQEALDQVTKGRTVLVIAHRLSTIQNADAIVVLSDGKVTEAGTHSSLLMNKGLYWELVKHQQLEIEQQQKDKTV